jgi:ADP-ribose pyrophosphatase YjhB (NUDIX family)
MTRTDYYQQPGAPKANSLVPGASAIVADNQGRILLLCRSDNGRWALPGGTMEVGETIAEAIAREVQEETGLDVEPERIVGVYTDPGHVFAFDDGEVRQQFSICFACRLVGGEIRPSNEATDVRFFAPADIKALNAHPSIRIRIDDFLKGEAAAFIR